jgi:hypothetical protein
MRAGHLNDVFERKGDHTLRSECQKRVLAAFLRLNRFPPYVSFRLGVEPEWRSPQRSPNAHGDVNRTA